MNSLKRAIALLLVVCVAFCLVGCGDAYSKFKPTGVDIIDRISDDQYEYSIDDEEITTQMWKIFKGLEIYENDEAELGEAYLHMTFYNENRATEAVFTIYENGSCCMGYDYQTLYTVENGRSAYIELCELYESYDPQE